jgi:CheY-like chemotaxis protein
VTRRVIVVRPDRPAHTLIAAAFEMSGCEVHCASDGHAAWTLVVQKRPRILLIEYPEQLEDGLELLHRAHAVRELGTLVATAVSNSLSAEQTGAIASYSDLCYRMPKPPAEVVRAILEHAERMDRERGAGAADAPVDARAADDPTADLPSS